VRTALEDWSQPVQLTRIASIGVLLLVSSVPDSGAQPRDFTRILACRMTLFLLRLGAAVKAVRQGL